MIRTIRLTLIAFAAALLLAPLTLVAAEPPSFRFDAPPGPRFSEAEKQTQRDRGASVVPIVRKVFESGVESVRIPPGDYGGGATPFTNIVITGNTFIRPGSVAIRLDSFHGGIIAGNRIEQTARPSIELKRCSGIRKENNQHL